MRVKYSYTKYERNFLATAISWLGNVLGTLIMAGGMFAAVGSLFSIFQGAGAEGAGGIFAGIVIAAVGGLFMFLCDKLARWIAVLFFKMRQKKQ